MTIRIPNLTASVHCMLCCDDGIVVVAEERRTRYRWDSKRSIADGHYPEQVYGPCPECEMGERNEFPQKGMGPWGSQGYWRGRDHTYLKNACNCNTPRASEREVREWMDMLRRLSVGSEHAPPEPPSVPETDPPDPTPDPPPEDDTGPHDAAPETPADEVSAGEGDDAESPPSDMVESVADEAAEHHLCPGYDPPRDVPFSEADCAHCNPPAEDADDDIIPF